jgi:hypothetical protein
MYKNILILILIVIIFFIKSSSSFGAIGAYLQFYNLYYYLDVTITNINQSTRYIVNQSQNVIFTYSNGQLINPVMYLVLPDVTNLVMSVTAYTADKKIASQNNKIILNNIITSNGALYKYATNMTPSIFNTNIYGPPKIITVPINPIKPVLSTTVVQTSNPIVPNPIVPIAPNLNVPIAPLRPNPISNQQNCSNDQAEFCRYYKQTTVCKPGINNNSAYCGGSTQLSIWT